MTFREFLRRLARFWTGGRRALLDQWRAAIATRGLHEVAAIGFPSPILTARSDGLRVELASLVKRVEGAGTSITITRAGGAPFPLELSRESFWTGLEKRRGHVEVEVGERLFDDDFYIRGDAARVLAMLDAPTRRAI